MKRLASFILWYLRRAPLWSKATGRRNADKDIIEKIIDLGAENPAYKY
jgi:hypothetical protein